jgi:hypothetical protein
MTRMAESKFAGNAFVVNINGTKMFQGGFLGTLEKANCFDQIEAQKLW